jgi:hypothetical protein
MARLYIGPNYYGDQSNWNITLVWGNGYEQVFTKRKLTRYNSYVVWDDEDGVHMKQSFEKAYARYNQGPPPRMFGGGDSGIEVSVSVPEKISVANNYQPTREMARDYGDRDSGRRRTTRDLVFEEDDEEEEARKPVPEGSTAANVKGESIAVKATVELTRDGKTTTVLPTEDFKSGDRVKLLFTSNRPGFVYWLNKGTSGEYQVLFPSAKAGQNNSVERNAEYTFPTKGAWRFDDRKGTETVVCVLAPAKISQLEEAIKLSDAGDKSGASDLVASLVNGHERKRTTRDLVFEEEDEGDVNTKIQITAEGDPFVAIYELEHL